MANNEQVKKYIEKLVREEIRRLLPVVIKEAFGEMISEAMMAQPVQSRPPAPRSRPQAIQESVNEGYEDYPTMTGRTFDRGRMAELMGYGSMTPQPSRGRPNLITVDAMMSDTETGTPRPIDPNSLPDHLLDAFNRDYTDFMKEVARKQNGY